MKNKKSKSNMRVLIFDQNTQTLTAEHGINIEAETVECESGVYPIRDAQKWVDEWNGHIYYIFHAAIPERVEAANLKQLRRSSALQRIFDYDKKQPMDMFKLLPWLVILVLILFGGR